MTRRNALNREADESMAAIRAGQGLLVGLLRCGHCGRKLHVRYWGGPGPTRVICAKATLMTAGNTASVLVAQWSIVG